MNHLLSYVIKLQKEPEALLDRTIAFLEHNVKLKRPLQVSLINLQSGKSLFCMHISYFTAFTFDLLEGERGQHNTTGRQSCSQGLC